MLLVDGRRYLTPDFLGLSRAYGSVHMAKHSLSKHVVAIKKILVDKSDPVAKLAAEINILRDLDSTHIVRCV
jgi:serine/threonine protein kinase